MAKPDVIKRSLRKCGGCARKVAGLIPGDLHGCLGMPVHAWRDRRVGRAGRGKALVRRGEVSRGCITSGVDGRWEGPNEKPSVRTFVVVIVALTAANPFGGWPEGLRVKPEDHRPERSSDPAPDGTSDHLAEAGSLWEQFLSRWNLAEALRRVEHKAGAPGIDGMSTKGAGAVVEGPLAEDPLAA
jgi:hypothetical protein